MGSAGNTSPSAGLCLSGWNRRTRGVVALVVAASAILLSTGCGAGGKNVSLTSTGAGAGTSSSTDPNRHPTLTRFDVDVKSGKVKLTPGVDPTGRATKSFGRAIITGAAVTFTSSNLLTTTGDSGQRLMNVTFTNNTGQSLGSNMRLVVNNLQNSTSSTTSAAAAAVSTLAGNGTNNDTDGTGSAATFSAPQAIAMGAGTLANSVLVVDPGASKLRVTSLAGVVTSLPLSASVSPSALSMGPA